MLVEGVRHAAHRRHKEHRRRHHLHQSYKVTKLQSYKVTKLQIASPAASPKSNIPNLIDYLPNERITSYKFNL